MPTDLLQVARLLMPKDLLQVAWHVGGSLGIKSPSISIRGFRSYSGGWVAQKKKVGCPPVEAFVFPPPIDRSGGSVLKCRYPPDRPFQDQHPPG